MKTEIKSIHHKLFTIPSENSPIPINFPSRHKLTAKNEYFVLECANFKYPQIQNTFSMVQIRDGVLSDHSILSRGDFLIKVFTFYLLISLHTVINSKQKYMRYGFVHRFAVSESRHWLDKVTFESDQFYFSEVTKLIFINQSAASTQQIKINYMSSKLAKLLLIAVLMFALASGMPTEPRLPSDIASSDILMTDSSVGREMLVVVTKTELSIYKLGESDSYTLLHKKPVCQASALSVAQTGFLPSNENDASLYSVVVGCKNGYFHIYEISFQTDGIVKSFAKKLNQPIVKLLSALPYLLVSTKDNIYMFNMKDYQIELEIPVTGELSQVSFQSVMKTITASDQASEIQIMIKDSGLEIRRKPVTREILRPILIHSRLLQNKTAVCGDNTIDPNEQCDDGNTVSGDGCTQDCKLEYCGDGTTNNNGAEQCDDGNNVALDGCTNCTYDCGNGNLDPNEECDDGNRVDNDGCSSKCLLEKKESYKAAIGVGLGVSAVGLVGVVGGTIGSTAASGVSSSLVGVAPMPVPVPVPAGPVGISPPMGHVHVPHGHVPHGHAFGHSK